MSQEEECQNKTSTKTESPVTDVLKITSFNVASLRACWNKGFPIYVRDAQPDILCLQETKMHLDTKEPLTEFKLPGYYGYFYHSKRKGLHGTAIYTKIKPISVKPAPIDKDGRNITMEFDKFYLLNTYVQNAGQELEFLDYKINEYNPKIERWIKELEQKKPVIWAGDLNVAHEDIDIWTPDGHENTAGFTDKERAWFHNFLNEGHTDIWRSLHPQSQEFSFFSFRGQALLQNHGWRIDYFIMKNEFIKPGLIIDCRIETGNDLSDHLPLSLYLDRKMILSDKDEPNTITDVTALTSGPSLNDFFTPKKK